MKTSKKSLILFRRSLHLNLLKILHLLLLQLLPRNSNLNEGTKRAFHTAILFKTMIERKKVILLTILKEIKCYILSVLRFCWILSLCLSCRCVCIFSFRSVAVLFCFFQFSLFMRSNIEMFGGSLPISSVLIWLGCINKQLPAIIWVGSTRRISFAQLCSIFQICFFRPSYFVRGLYSSQEEKFFYLSSSMVISARLNLSWLNTSMILSIGNTI